MGKNGDMYYYLIDVTFNSRMSNNQDLTYTYNFDFVKTKFHTGRILLLILTVCFYFLISGFNIRKQFIFINLLLRILCKTLNNAKTWWKEKNPDYKAKCKTFLVIKSNK